MRCETALHRIGMLSEAGGLDGDPPLKDHLSSCPTCAEEYRRHRVLLDRLSAAEPLPPFRDLAPLVLARLPVRRTSWVSAWRWGAAAAMIVGALALGYLLGGHWSNASPSTPQSSMAASYQEALSGLPEGSVEIAYVGTVAPSAGERP